MYLMHSSSTPSIDADRSVSIRIVFWAGPQSDQVMIQWLTNSNKIQEHAAKMAWEATSKFLIASFCYMSICKCKSVKSELRAANNQIFHY